MLVIMTRGSLSKRIRDYAQAQYIEPARRRGDPSVRIVAGDVHKALRLVNRVPTVCQALASREFLRQNHLTVEAREGPPSGLGTRASFTYRVTGEPHPSAAEDPLLRIWGIGKDLFANPGDWEASIRRDRERFYGPMDESEE